MRDEDEEFADAVTVLVGTGMHRAELLGLQWEAVELLNDEIHVAFATTDGGEGSPQQRYDLCFVDLQREVLAFPGHDCEENVDPANLGRVDGGEISTQLVPKIEL